jgi:putative ATPase
VPQHLRTKSRKSLASRSGTQDAELEYLYSHDYPENYVPQAYLPEGKTYYIPSSNGHEKKIKDRLDYLRSLFEKEPPPAP